jgi:hypothetical protein
MAVVIDAGNDGHQTAAERDKATAERTMSVQRMLSSQPMINKWKASGQAVIDEVGRRADHVEDNGCFVLGCTATYTFKSRAAYDEAYREATSSEGYIKWPSGKKWLTPEEQDDGRVIVALILYQVD